MPSPIVVIGSIGIDLTCRAPRLPGPGETILGSDFLTVPGGKGNNQAVGAAKLGADVHFVGRVGDDAFGQTLCRALGMHNVNGDFVKVTPATPSGVAMILVDDAGENSIVVTPGANARLTPADVDAAKDLIASASVVLLQLEVPIATVKHAIALCRKLGVYTVLDPAPAPLKAMPRALYGVNLLTPNETEAALLLQRKDRRTPDSERIAQELLSRGAQNVLLKLGAQGCLWMNAERQIEQVKGFKVKVADTTAAGDAFNGAFAVAYSEGMPWRDALRFANAAGALCCTKLGAQPALPTRKEVEKLLRA